MAPQDDPFGLFTDDYQATSTPTREATNPDIQSLEELLDFGFAEVPPQKTLLPSETLPSAPVYPLKNDLSELGDILGVEKVTTLGAEAPDVRGMDVPVSTGCIELVEEEGDLEPSPLDKLNELLGI